MNPNHPPHPLLPVALPALILLLATCLPQPAEAQAVTRRVFWGPQSGDIELTLSGGGTSDAEFSSGSGAVNLSLGVFLSPAWELSARQSLGFDDDAEGFDVRGATRAALDYHFDLDRLQPLVGISFGGGYGDDVSPFWLAGVEVGLKYFVQRKTFIFGLVEYTWAFRDWEQVTANIDDGGLGYSIGIGFNF